MALPGVVAPRRFGGRRGVNRPLASGVNDLLDWSLIFLCFQPWPLLSISAFLRRRAGPMPKPPHQQQPMSLADLRRDIDRIDEAMHALLIESGEIIERLIAVKQPQDSCST